MPLSYRVSLSTAGDTDRWTPNFFPSVFLSNECACLCSFPRNGSISAGDSGGDGSAGEHSRWKALAGSHTLKKELVVVVMNTMPEQQGRVEHVLSFAGEEEATAAATNASLAAAAAEVDSTVLKISSC
mgnify:CR=1 FL=1